MKIRTTALALLLVCSNSVAGAAETASVMRNVYDALAYLLPLSVRGDDAQASPWDKELVDAKLDVLQGAAAALVEHAATDDTEFGLLARSFDRLVDDIAVSFRQEWPDYAYYSLMELTDHCASCHARLPAESQALFGQRLVARMRLEGSDAATRARLLVATRQFDEALALLERRLLEPGLDPIEAEYRGLMVQYLRIAIGTAPDLARVGRFLERYAARDDLPYYLERRLAHWQRTLIEQSDALAGAPELAAAQRLFERATQLTLVPGSRLRAVDDLIAARLMRTWLEAHPTADAATRAQLYFRLAIVALRTSEPEPAVPEMEMLLVAAIEAEPHGPHAEQAYSILEEYGYVHEEHLARQLESQALIDMAALRAKIGGGETPAP